METGAAARSASVAAIVGGGGSGFVGALYIGGVIARICPMGGDSARESGTGTDEGLLKTKSPLDGIKGKSEGLVGSIILPLYAIFSPVPSCDMSVLSAPVSAI